MYFFISTFKKNLIKKILCKKASVMDPHTSLPPRGNISKSCNISLSVISSPSIIVYSEILQNIDINDNIIYSTGFVMLGIYCKVEKISIDPMSNSPDNA